LPLRFESFQRGAITDLMDCVGDQHFQVIARRQLL
jgi:hypothetical protein